MSNEKRVLNKEYVSLFFINLIVAISFSMVTATMSLYVVQLGSSATMAGMVVGALSIASLCMRPFSGIICDRFRRRLLLQISLLVVSISMIGYSLTDNISVLIAFRGLHGFGFSIATTVTMAMVAGTVPASKLTQGMGYFAIGQTVANAISPGIGLWIGEKWGYFACFRLASLLLLIAVVLSMTCVARSAKPLVKPGRRIKVSDFFAWEAFPFCALSIVVAGSTGIENSFITLMGMDYQLGSVGWYFTLGAVALFISRVFIGKFADRNPRRIICLGTGAIAVAFLVPGLHRMVFGLAGAAIAFAVTAVLKALGLGAVQPALQSASLRSVSEDRRGAASCTYYLGTDVGQAFGPIVGGALVKPYGYSGMFALAAVPLLLGAVLFNLYARKALRRKADDKSTYIAGNP